MNQAPSNAPMSNESAFDDDESPSLSTIEILTWLGEGKRLIAAVTVLALLGSLTFALLKAPVYTARTTLLPPVTQQQGGSAALAALGSLGGLAGNLGGKTSDELYVALLKSDSVWRALDERFKLRAHYKVQTHEALRRALPGYIRVASEKKSGVITVEVDDKDPEFAAALANAHVGEVTRVLGRLAVSEAQQRRLFFEQQLRKIKEDLIKAETDLRRVQERSGVIVLDKQAEALIAGAAQIRASIAEREVQLKVMRTGATDQNPDVIRLMSEVRALRSELARMESSQGGNEGSVVDMPVGKLPEAAIDYVRARRELKLQETLMEAMLRQFELAKMDEAKEGPPLQQVDKAMPPDYKSKPSRLMIVLGGTLAALLGSMLWVLVRGYKRAHRVHDEAQAQAWGELRRAWRLRR